MASRNQKASVMNDLVWSDKSRIKKFKIWCFRVILKLLKNFGPHPKEYSKLFHRTKWHLRGVWILLWLIATIWSISWSLISSVHLRLAVRKSLKEPWHLLTRFLFWKTKSRKSHFNNVKVINSTRFLIRNYYQIWFFICRCI